MHVSDIMTASFDAIEATASLTDAARKMKSLNVGFLPVRQGRELIGVLTDRDIVIRALAEGFEPDSTQVKDIASPDIVYCYEDISIEDAARIMEENQIRRLIACDYDGEPVGVVSLGDLAVKAGQDQLSGEALERISEPALSAR